MNRKARNFALRGIWFRVEDNKDFLRNRHRGRYILMVWEDDHWAIVGECATIRNGQKIALHYVEDI